MTDYDKATSILRNDLIRPEEIEEMLRHRPKRSWHMIASSEEKAAAAFEAIRDVEKYPKDLLASYEQSLPDEDELRLCADGGYALIPSPPEPIKAFDIRTLMPEEFQSEAEELYDL